MKLISTRNGRLYFNFRYQDPITNEDKRNRSAIGLDDTPENRIMAQTLALNEKQRLTNALSQHPINQTVGIQNVLSEKDVPFREFILSYMSDDVFTDTKPGTQTLYERYIRLYILPFFERYKTSEINLDKLKQFRTNLKEKKKLNGKTKAEILSKTKSIVNFGIEEGFIPPFKTKKIPKISYCSEPAEHLSEEECDLLLEYIKIHEPHYHFVTLFTLSTGLRRGEIIALKWKDVFISRKEIKIRRSFHKDDENNSTKNGKIDTLPIPEHIVDTLKQIKEKRNAKPNDFVFLSPKGKRYGENTLTRMLKRCCERAGVTVTTWHGLRHTFGTLMTQKHGIALTSVLMRHSGIQVTNRYYHSNENEKREAIESLRFGQNSGQ